MKPVQNRTLKDEVADLRRVYTFVDRDRALFLNTGPEDYKIEEKMIRVYVICDSAEGNATLYKLDADKSNSAVFGDQYDVDTWAAFVREQVPDILRNTTLAYLNRTIPGAPWRVRGIIGWHFVRAKGAARRVLPAKLRRPK